MKSALKKISLLCFSLILSACSLGAGNAIGGILGGQSSLLPEKPQETVQNQSVVTPFYDEKLAAAINALEAQYEMDPANVCIMVENFATGSMYAQNETNDYFAASTYKLPLAMLYYEDLARMNADLVNPDPSLSLGWFDLPTVLDYLHAAIVYSDNDAAMALYENMGGWENYVHRRQIYRNENSDIILSKIDKTTNTQLKNLPAEGISAAGYEDSDVALVMNADLLAAQFEANYIDGSYLENVLEYLYNHKDQFSVLLEDMKASEPESYLNGRLPGYYYQKYGYYEDALNITGLSLEASPYLCVVLTQGEAGAYNFMGDLGVLLKDYYNPDTLPEAREQPVEEPEPEPIEEAGAQWIPDFPVSQDGTLPEIPQQYVTDENGNAQLYLQESIYPYGQVAPAYENQNSESGGQSEENLQQPESVQETMPDPGEAEISPGLPQDQMLYDSAAAQPAETVNNPAQIEAESG